MIERALSKDTLVKWAAVVLAALMWLYVVNDSNPPQTRIINFDLSYSSPEGRVVVSSSPPRVTISLEGRQASLDRLAAEKIVIPVDLEGAPDGVSQVPIAFDPPFSGIRVIDLNPRVVTVDMDTVGTRELPIAVVTSGSPNEEFEAGKPQVVESAVTVTGARRLLDRTQYVAGEIDISGAVVSINGTVDLVPRDVQGVEVRGVQLDPPTATVTVPLVARPPSKTVPVRVSTVGTPKTGYRLDKVTVTPATVKFRADPSVGQYINEILGKSVDLSGRDATFTQTVNLTIPANVIYTGAASVTVKIDIVEDTAERSFTIPVMPRNLGFQYRFTFSPPEVTVVLSGRSDLISAMKDSDVEAYVDAAGMGEGSHRPLVAPTFPAGAKLIEVRPSYVNLEIEKR